MKKPFLQKQTTAPVTCGCRLLNVEERSFYSIADLGSKGNPLLP